MLNRQQTADRLGICTTSLLDMRLNNELPPHYPNPTRKRYGWREDDIELFLECEMNIMLFYCRSERYRDMETFNKTDKE